MGHGTRGATRPATGTAARPAAGDGGTAVYLYGVARDLDPAALDGATGVAGAPVRGVVAGDLTALVSTVSTVKTDEYGEAALRSGPADRAWAQATAQAHHDVVDRAARTAPTAPVRVATLYRDDARVAEILNAHGARFAAILDRITGRSEWNVAAYASPETLHGGPENPGGGLEPRAEPPTGPQPATGHGLGKARLRRPRADAGHRVGHRADALHAALDDHAAASRHRPRRDPGPRGAAQILNAAYLLDEEQVPSFLAVTRAAGERLDGIDIEVTGPRPPYSFVDPADTTPAPDPRDTAR